MAVPSADFYNAALRAWNANDLRAGRGPFMVGANGQIFLRPEYAHMLGHRIEMNIVASFLEAVAQAGKDASIFQAALAAGLADAIQSPKGQELIARRHEKLAAQMRRAVAVAYGQTVTRRKVAQSYRIGRGRYAGGALLRALGNPDMAVGDVHGIKFVNQTRLAFEARHWARLNFGARPASTPSPEQFAVTIFNRPGGAPIGFQAEPRPAFAMPRGFWVTPEGEVAPWAGSVRTRRQFERFGSRYGLDKPLKARPKSNAAMLRALRKPPKNPALRKGMDAFYPLGHELMYPTRGIVGKNFLDAGFRAFAKNIGKEYSDLLDFLATQINQSYGKAVQAIYKADTRRGGKTTISKGRR